jgi:hypothetical protein
VQHVRGERHHRSRVGACAEQKRGTRRPVQ